MLPQILIFISFMFFMYTIWKAFLGAGIIIGILRFIIRQFFY